MNVIDELVHYCKEEDPIGALMLTGEWGSGKTYLIEHDLKEALGPDYAIVRVSLFGVTNITSLQQTIRKKWITVCYPFVNKIREKKELAQKNSGLLNMISALIKKLNPVVGSTAEILNSMNVMDTLHVEPEFEDWETFKKRRAILVFDDLERCNIPITELLGAVNEACENRGFNTIVVTNLKYLMKNIRNDDALFHMLKGKAISQTVLYQPDYAKVIHQIILEKEWRTDEYREYLIDREGLIYEAFAYEPEDKAYEKSYNLLTLITTLKSFYRVYYHLNKNGIENIDDFLYSFIAYSFCNNNGITRDGKTSFEFTEEEIKILYPQYNPEFMLSSLKTWIIKGGFDEEALSSELEEYKEKNK